MEIAIFVIIGALIIFALTGYAVYLLLNTAKTEKKALQRARQARADRLKRKYCDYRQSIPKRRM